MLTFNTIAEEADVVLSLTKHEGGRLEGHITPYKEREPTCKTKGYMKMFFCLDMIF